MVAFVIGSKTGNREDLMAAIDYAKEFDGLTDIRVSDDYPGLAILCFETQESAQTAQWMLEMAGAEGRDESDTSGHPGDDS